MPTNYIKNPDTIPEMREVMNKWFDLLEKENDEQVVEDVCVSLNDLLDVYLEDDMFGTEGQLDPRGDRR